ncbi:MAG: fumarylacetoacetate hydrolase family protein [Bdellovibrionota bacterium]
MTIYCVGRNYKKHAEELGNEVPESPIIFLKAESSVRGFTDAPIAFDTETFHFEAELVLKIGENAAIESYMLGIDLTRRAVQSELKAKGLPWTLAKSFQGSAILGKERPFDGKNLTFEFLLNGERKQLADTTNMLWSCEELCRYINSFSPLMEGDLIFTGTPEGVGEIRKHDKFSFRINGENEEGFL